MNLSWRQAGWGLVSIAYAASAAAFFIGKYRTAAAACAAAFLVFFVMLLVERWNAKAVAAFLAFLLAAVVVVACRELLPKQDLFGWLITRKDQGYYLEIPALKHPSGTPKTYLSNLIENHLGEERKGIPLKEINPKLSRLDADWFEQLDWMGVRYVIFSAKAGKENPLDVTGLPVAGSFPEGIVFYVPRQAKIVTTLFGSGFDGERRMKTSQESIYLFNLLEKEISVRLDSMLASRDPATAELRLAGTNVPLWKGEVAADGTPVALEKMTLQPGKNKLTLTLLDRKGKDGEWISLANRQPRRSLAVKAWKVTYAGVTPSVAAYERGNVWENDPGLEKWFARLPDGATVLEFPVEHKNWKTPVDYASLSADHARCNVNYKFDADIPGFAAQRFTHVTHPRTILWGTELGIDYIVIHRSLYSVPPFLEPPPGLVFVEKFGESSIYRLDPRRVRFEAEKELSQAGINVIDIEASEGGARRIAGNSQNERRVYIVYNQDVPVPPGKYRAKFLLKVQERSDETVAVIDALTGEGKNILARKDIKGSDFEKPLDYQAFHLEFNLPQKALLELRVFYRGKNNPLWADAITLEQISAGGES